MRRIITRIVTIVTTTTWTIRWQAEDADQGPEPASAAPPAGPALESPARLTTEVNVDETEPAVEKEAVDSTPWKQANHP
jgi:hypothetical protein